MVKFLERHFSEPLTGMNLAIITVLIIYAGITSGCSFFESEETQSTLEAGSVRLHGDLNLLQECQNTSVEPDVVIKGDIPRGQCFHMYVLVVKYDKSGGKCSFEGVISDKLQQNIQDYSARSIFGYYTNNPKNIDKVKNCPDLDGVDIYDTVKIYGIYDNTIEVKRQAVGAAGTGAARKPEYCYDQLPLFSIVSVELQTKRTFADVGEDQAARLQNNVLSFC